MNRDDYIEKLKSLFERYSIIEAYKKSLYFGGQELLQKPGGMI